VDGWAIRKLVVVSEAVVDSRLDACFRLFVPIVDITCHPTALCIAQHMFLAMPPALCILQRTLLATVHSVLFNVMSFARLLGLVCCNNVINCSSLNGLILMMHDTYDAYDESCHLL